MWGIPKEVFGTLATLSSLALFLFGMPKQIWDNRKDKYCYGSKVLQILLVAVYLFWTMYAFAVTDKFMIFSNLPGLVVGLVLCGQLWHYRKNQKPK